MTVIVGFDEMQAKLLSCEFYHSIYTSTTVPQFYHNIFYFR